ncbi:MAG TPA: sigma-70 family RNA polymerase sigma factor [Verrucomicrobiae bacterium]|jgi:RNA polymerase sigma-70 factor (ECF subfamily)
MPALTLLASNGLDWRSGWPIGWPPKLPAATEARPAPVLERPLPAEPGLADADWIARVRRGDEDAARALVERLYPTVIKSVRRHLPPRTSEEDLTQAVFAKVFKNLHQFSGFVPLEHWVSRIAVNTCLNQLKHESGRPELRMSDLSEEQEAVVQNLACTTAELPDDQSRGARELLEKLLAPLRPDDRLVITLLHLEDRSVKEVSRLTGWSVSLVKVKAFRARSKVRRIWQTMLKGGQW